MATTYPGHYSYIIKETHRDGFKIILLILALVAAVVLGWGYTVMFGEIPVELAVPVATKPILTNMDREDIMRRPSNVVPNKTLTDAQREAIMRGVRAK